MAATWGSTANSSLQNILSNAVGTADSAVGSAQSGVSAVLGGQGVVNNAVNNMTQLAGQQTQTANAALASASKAQAQYDALTPIADLFGTRATDLWSEGSGLTDRANALFGTGDAILNMDPNATGIAGEYMKMYSLLSPDRYVSQAASDVQGSFQNAQGQAERQLARKGVSAGSGASQALQKQYATALATALAAAKTKARQTGIDQQSAYLDKMLSAANTLYGTGNETEKNALTAKNLSLSASGSQADTLAKQAAGTVSVGGLQIDAGNLFGSAATTYGNAAKVNTDYLTLVNNAYGNLSDAQKSAADSKLKAASIEVSANNGGGGGGWSTTSSGSGNTWVKTDSGRDTSQSGSPWFTTWTNSKTGATVSGDGLFNPNNG